MKKYICVLPLLAVSVPAWGQIQTGDGQSETVFVEPQSSEIVVSGLSFSLGESAYSTTNVSIPSSQTVENALRDVPGLQQFRRSDARTANPTSQGVTLRGLGGNASSRALLILDGVPQADPFGGWVAWPGYDALALNSVRITRGGGSGADGQGAISGTIELFSDDVGDRIELGAAYGSRNSVDADLLFGREL